ncbi:MAG: D-2-hydroxyacid dehydrogenase [Bacteriovoracaceae bacterium]|nr:D-2-hydroxyacid dehydrogenase [Bacteriovoracaceae bacterium]
MRIAILDAKTIGDDIDLSRFNDLGELEIFQETSKEQILDRGRDKDVLILNKVRLDKSTLKELKNLKLVCITATGTDNVDLEAAQEFGIEVRNVKGYSTDSVAQLTLAMVLSLQCKLAQQDHVGKKEWVNSKIFTNLDFKFNELAGKTWGIVGLGNIGQKVAQIASAFGCNVVYYSSSGVDRSEVFKRVELDELLGSDIITVHCPLTDSTRDLINADNLHQLKDEAVLVNVARGGIVNESDIVEKFKSSNIRLGFDVASKEPIQEDNPLLNISDSQRLIMTSHIAWASTEARKRLMDGVYNNIKTFLDK